ncbi:MAG: GNAT family N-acetyltransferase [Candidatus Hydrogenedentes bacterium]|nr:GNAT family N-acetyltransferase [Candidatus Hydrogenedentota bacterium]
MTEITYDANWLDTYRDAIVTADEAVKHIPPGKRIFVGTGCAQPQQLVHALADRADELVDTEIIHLLTLGSAPYAKKELISHFQVNSFFISANVRDIIQQGLGDYTPIFLSDIPRLFSSGQLPVDVALIQVTPPDDRGLCSLGISVDIVKSAAENAGMVIAEVNPRMPRTLGNTSISIHDIDYLVHVDEPLIETELPKTDEVTRQIGEYVASLVEDGSTIELGIGRIPQSVLEFLGEKKDLGIHTEMLTDAVVDLVERGVITGSRKSIDRGKITASFCTGTRLLYDYIDNNPTFAFHPTEYVNDPFVIAQQNKMVAINVALEVDLTGQVCADSLGTKFYSGIGGQVDFNRGAARSPGGKAIIALPSTAQNGKVSRIVTRLSPGAGVVTTRGDVHYVVTEYGVAYLHGKNVQERTLALISVAHPDFRSKLLREAIEAKYVREEFANVTDKVASLPDKFRKTLLLDDGTLITFRPVHLTDEPLMRDLLHNLSRETLYYRFMSNMKWVPRKEVQNFVYLDHRKELVIVGTLPDASGETIIAVGGYYLDEKTNRAEVAFIVKDEWQNKGIGTFMLQYLTRLARRNGIAGFTAEVLQDNKPMQAVFRNSNLRASTKLSHNVISFVLNFD